MNHYDWIIIAGSMLFSAFFAGMEIAFISANKLLIELKNKQGSLTAGILSNFVNHPSKFISTTLVGNNIGLVVYGIYMARLLNPFLEHVLPAGGDYEFIVLFLQTIISTLIVLVCAEFIPKVLFRINPDLTLNILAFPFLIFYYLFWPIVHFIIWLSHGVLKQLLGTQYKEKSPVFNRADLDHYITHASDSDIEDDAEVDTEMFRNALDLSNIKCRECMTPRNEIAAIEINNSMEELYELFSRTRLSKILVYRDSIDHIIGYVHQKELFKHPKHIGEVLFDIDFVPETLPVFEVLNIFSRNHRSMAVVVDEMGTTSGVLTIEDILEEVFGEIDDEHDVEKLTEIKINDKEYIFNARLEIDYINDKYQLNIPSGEYLTIGGFIIAETGNIPQKSDKITIANFQFEILKSSRTRLEEVHLICDR